MSLNDTTGSVIFQAEFDFTPTHKGEIALRVGDQCYVQKPVLDPKGWLEGFNSRSHENGQFPGTYCSILNDHATQPPLPPKPSERAAPRKVLVNEHHLVKFNVTKPSYCQNCNGYIWGGSTICLRCNYCNMVSHMGCYRTFERQMCRRKTCQLDDSKKPVEGWSTSEVLEWMLAVHFHPYVQLFRKQNIDGTMLCQMNQHSLKKIGISFDFHAHNLILCIKELTSPPPTEKQLGSSIDLADCSEIDTHKLIEHTFTTHQTCDICQKPMFGIIRQGLMCYVCGIQFHRPCAVSCRRVCQQMYSRGRRPSDSQDPSFCCNFETKNIPPVMRKCINAVANGGYGTKKIYRDNCGYEECRSLRAALNQNTANVNMNDGYWRDPLCAAYVLKTFLLELPVPLVSFKYYDDFISLATTMNVGSDEIYMLMRKLPESNFAHLDFLLRHLVNVLKHSDENEMTIESLAEEFSVLILRPPDNDIWTFARNLVYHERVVHVLLSTMMGQENPQTDSDFKDEKWFWPEATRKDVSQRLSGTPDGSFSIRKSAEGRKGEWTLTVRKEGRERLIRIIQQKGLYGFREELLNFGSLSELVNYFREHSLEDYNPKLNIKLLHPCGRPDQITVPKEDQEHLWNRYQQVVDKLNHVKFMEMKLEEKQLTLEECRGLSESQIDVVSFLEEQIVRSQQFFEEAAARDRDDLQSSIVTLNKLLNEEKGKWARLDEELTALKQECDQLTTQLTEESPEVPMLQEEYNQLDPKVRETHAQHFKNEEKDEKNLEELEKIYDSIPAANLAPSVTDLQEEYWLFEEELGRNKAKEMLENKPDGTFLVRASTRYPYAISMVHDNTVKHIPILEGPNGYGFAEPHNIYRTLHELINHYHHQSLRMHNRSLDTTLQFPYRFLEQTDDEPTYE